MDILSRLPSLVLTNVLGQIQSDKDLLNLISASPELLRVYTQYRNVVTRHRLANILDLDIDGTTLQDAQLIIHFPSTDGRKVSFSAISECLDTWDAQTFPNPLKQHSNPESITRLHRFFNRLVVFIEDYLSKSLDPFPARACMTIPTIGCIVPTAQFKGQGTDIQPVAFSSMERSIRRRLLQAFIRFELRCKVYHPRVWWFCREKPTYADTIDRSNEKLSLNDCEELCCVFEYLKGLYGAIFARCRHDSRFPERPVSEATVPDNRASNEKDKLLSAKEYGSPFPDDLYFNMENEAFPGVLDCESLPCLGLDVLSAILRSSELINTKGRRFRHWVSQLANQPDTSWILDEHFTQHRDLYPSSTKIHEWDWWMESLNHDRHSNRDTVPTRPEIDIDEQNLQLRLQLLQSAIYRQRAWIFFTGSSNQPCLPSWGHLAVQQELVGDFLSLELCRESRRYQKWLDYWKGRSWNWLPQADSSPGQDEDNSGGLNDEQFVPPTILRFFEKT